MNVHPSPFLVQGPSLLLAFVLMSVIVDWEDLTFCVTYHSRTWALWGKPRGLGASCVLAACGGIQATRQ